MNDPDLRLPEHLDLVATAPDGIQKLRGLILELAVRGKLVPQDPNDEPASELLKRIAKERVWLESEGTCKKSKVTPVVGDDDRASPLEMHRPRHCFCLFLVQFVRISIIQTWSAITCANDSASEAISNKARDSTIVANKSWG